MDKQNKEELHFVYCILSVKKEIFTIPSITRYEASMRALQDVTSAMQGGQWEEAMELYTAAKSAWQELRKSHDLR